MSWLTTWLVAVVVAQGGTTTAAPPATTTPVSFLSEVIELSVEPDSLRVDGLYRLRCAPDLNRETFALFYPYPRDPELGGARTVALAWRGGDQTTWQPLAIQEVGRGAGARWQVPARAGQTVEVRTTYRQARPGPYARYIVTTTQHWGRPLEHARFLIHLPEGAEPEAFSFPFTRCPGEGVNTWCYEAVEFLPERDITVRWTISPGAAPRDGE